MSNLLKSIRLFYKKATLLQDTANRIMFGLTDPNRFDFVAARWAAHGAVDAIYYTTIAMVEEAKYDYNHPRANSLKYRFVNVKKSKPENIESLEKYKNLCAGLRDAFADKASWSPAYGGAAWAKIASTTVEIIDAFMAALSAKRYSDEEKDALNRVIIWLNVLDGLAHNTADVYDKLVSVEYYENRNQDEVYAPGEDKSVRPPNVLKQIYKMRDASEGKDPVKTYKEIEKYIHPRAVFQDYISLLTRDPEFKSKRYTEKELHNVRLFKMLKQTLSSILYSTETKLNNLKNTYNEIMTDKEYEDPANKYVLQKKIQDMRDLIDACKGNLWYASDQLKIRKELLDENNIDDYIKRIERFGKFTVADNMFKIGYSNFKTEREIFTKTCEMLITEIDELFAMCKKIDSNLALKE